MSEKQKKINDISFDRAGFQSKAITLKDARQKTQVLPWKMSNKS